MSSAHKIVNSEAVYPGDKFKSAQWVAEVLCEDIANGVYAPNSFLPSQRKLVELLGVPRRAVRIALEQLK